MDKEVKQEILRVTVCTEEQAKLLIELVIGYLGIRLSMKELMAEHGWPVEYVLTAYREGPVVQYISSLSPLDKAWEWVYENKEVELKAEIGLKRYREKLLGQYVALLQTPALVL
jgi:hypothetical protein